MVWQFAYFYEVVKISLLSGKNTKCSYSVFLLFFLSLSPAWAYRPKLPFHGLTLRKSLIKNHVTLFGLGRVVKPDQTKLGSTKPNKSCNRRAVEPHQFWRRCQGLFWPSIVSWPPPWLDYYYHHQWYPQSFSFLFLFEVILSVTFLIDMSFFCTFWRFKR